MEASDMEVTDSDQTSFLGQPFIQVKSSIYRIHITFSLI